MTQVKKTALRGADPFLPDGIRTTLKGMFTRGLFAILALAFTATAAAGAALPGLPTVPFLLAAVACGRRGWPALAARLESHPRWGALLRDWHQHRAVPRRAKWLAGAMMAASWALLALSGLAPWALGMLALLFCGLLGWLWARPESSGPGRLAGSCEQGG